MACTLSSSTLLWCPVIVGFVFIFALGIDTIWLFCDLYTTRTCQFSRTVTSQFCQSPSFLLFFLSLDLSVSLALLPCLFLHTSPFLSKRQFDFYAAFIFLSNPFLSSFFTFVFIFFLFCFCIFLVCTWRLTGDLCVTRRYRFIGLYIVHVWASNAAQKSTASVHTPKSSLSIHSFIIVI